MIFLFSSKYVAWLHSNNIHIFVGERNSKRGKIVVCWPEGSSKDCATLNISFWIHSLWCVLGWWKQRKQRKQIFFVYETKVWPREFEARVNLIFTLNGWSVFWLTLELKVSRSYRLKSCEHLASRVNCELLAFWLTTIVVYIMVGNYSHIRFIVGSIPTVGVARGGAPRLFELRYGAFKS